MRKKLRSDARLTRDEARVAVHLLEDGDTNASDLGRFFGVSHSVFHHLMLGTSYGIRRHRRPRAENPKATWTTGSLAAAIALGSRAVLCNGMNQATTQVD